MDLEAMITQLQRINGATKREQKVVISVLMPGSIGGSPCVQVSSLEAGFDWNAGKVMLTPQESLTTLTPEQVADIHKSVQGGQSWHALQAQTKLTTRIKAIESELAVCKARIAELEREKS